jgi:DNA invertase Pin-like site-specific DNA recombinase
VEKPKVKAAIYARYSTDLQSEASIDDQLRVCERLAKQHGFKVVAKFSDAAISGGTTARPGYQQMLEGARRRAFDVIIAEDTSRLWRNLSEQAPRLAELADLGVHVITHDLDTRSESAGILGAVLGASSEAYRKEIARRTRRGLEGLARNGKPAGGRSYGYVPASQSSSGQIEIDDEQAAVVARIFREYADGTSARAIAAGLNRDGVASPGSSRNRTVNMTKGWVQTVIAGSIRDGLGILNNEVYVGRVIWNRFRWIRSAADSSRRRRVNNPRSEWVVRTDESLRIISDRLWQRVKARQREQTRNIGERVKEGLSASDANRTGRGPKYLFSGLLKCGKCGANFVICNAQSYACGNRVNGGPCDSDVIVQRSLLEAGLLEGIRTQLASDEAFAETRRRVARLLKSEPTATPADHAKAISKAKAQVANLTDAIASGALRSSAAIAERLRAAEAELERLQAAQAAPKLPPVERLLPGLEADYRRLVGDLATSIASVNVEKARSELRRRLGAVRVDEKEDRIDFVSTLSPEAALLRIAGASEQMRYPAHS